MPLTYLKSNEILEDMLGNATHFPDPVFIGLLTAAPGLDGSGVVEPVGSGYARASVPNDPSAWSGATDAQLENLGVISFPTASGPWGTVTHVGFFSAASGGDLLAFEALSSPRVVTTGDDFRFNAGDLRARFT
jgi:hypothetical protein